MHSKSDIIASIKSHTNQTSHSWNILRKHALHDHLIEKISEVEGHGSNFLGFTGHSSCCPWPMYTVMCIQKFYSTVSHVPSILHLFYANFQGPHRPVDQCASSLCFRLPGVFGQMQPVLTKVLTNSTYLKSELGYPSAGTCVWLFLEIHRLLKTEVG